MLTSVVDQSVQQQSDYLHSYSVLEHYNAYACYNDIKESSLQLMRYGLSPRENTTMLLENNKSTDQPVHPCSLINIFVIDFLYSIIS